MPRSGFPRRDLSLARCLVPFCFIGAHLADQFCMQDDLIGFPLPIPVMVCCSAFCTLLGAITLLLCFPLGPTGAIHRVRGCSVLLGSQMLCSIGVAACLKRFRISFAAWCSLSAHCLNAMRFCSWVLLALLCVWCSVSSFNFNLKHS